MEFTGEDPVEMRYLFILALFIFLSPSYSYGGVPGAVHGNSDEGAGERASLSKETGPGERAQKEENADRGESAERLRGRIASNGGWRWAFRKKAVSLLKKEADSRDDSESAAIKTIAGIGPEDKRPLKEALTGKTEELRKAGDAAAGDLLMAAVQVMEDGNGADELETLLRSIPHAGMKRLGWLVLARYYEKKGFYPEAHGYYSSILKDIDGSGGGGGGMGEDGRELLRLSASFGNARLLFFEGKFDSSKAAYGGIARKGNPYVDIWLANTLFIKGEVGYAWEIYERAGALNPEAYGVLDHVTLLSVADMFLTKGMPERAREIYTRLHSTYSKDGFLGSFFAVRSADSYLVEGDVKEAVRAYESGLEESGGEEGEGGVGADKGEGAAYLALSLADAYAQFLVEEGEGREVMLDKAEKIYADVAGKDGAPKEFALLGLARVEVRRKNYGEAVKTLEAFRAGFSTSDNRFDADDLLGNTICGWIDSLYSSGDHYATVTVSLRHENYIPFGRKAEMSLKTGNSYLNLLLYSDAIEALNSAAKLARGKVAEEALVSLAKAHLGKRDAEGALLALKTLSARFPKTGFGDVLPGLFLRANYMKGDYAGAARVAVPGKDYQAMLLKARSLARIKKHKEAAIVYGLLIKAYRETGDKKGLIEAYTGKADSDFVLEKYKEAAEGYGAALSELKGVNGAEAAWPLYRRALSYGRAKGGKDAYREAAEELKGLIPPGDLFARASSDILREVKMPKGKGL